MNELILLSPSHLITVLLCILAAVFVPKYFENSSDKSKKFFSYLIILLLLINQAMDFYREGILINRWQEGLPLHLCDFSTMAVILYFLTQKRDFFVFAFFFGIAGGGMSILTPDTVYGFPLYWLYTMSNRPYNDSNGRCICIDNRQTKTLLN